MSLFEELIEGKKKDKQIVKSFETKETLSDQIFEEQKKGHFVMREDIRKKLLEISDDFVESFGVDFFIHDVVLTGSLANYNWSQYSDVDLHIIIDFEESKYEMELLKEFFDAKKNVWNEKHNIKIKGFDVEVYVQDISEDHISSGVYSILHGKWVIEPKKEEPNIDDRKILEKGEEYGKKIDKLVSNGVKKDTMTHIEGLRKKIKEFRQSGLETGGEYSYENLTFKLLRRNGYIQKLLRLKTTLTDKKLSVAQ
jgi:predicted nucleotidyltransferase